MFRDSGLRILAIRLGTFYAAWLLAVFVLGYMVVSLSSAGSYKSYSEKRNITKNLSVSNGTSSRAQKKSSAKSNISHTKYAAVWDELALCESSGDWNINTGNGYYGGLQFKLSSWQAVGGSGLPHQSSKTEQIYRAEKLKDMQGWNAWPECSSDLSLR